MLVGAWPSSFRCVSERAWYWRRSASPLPVDSEAGLGTLDEAVECDGTGGCDVEQPSLEDLKADYFSGEPRSDLNRDGVVDFLDLGLLRSRSLAWPSRGTSVSSDGVSGQEGENFLFFADPGQLLPLEGFSVLDQDQVFIDLNMSFSDVTVGGGIEILLRSLARHDRGRSLLWLAWETTQTFAAPPIRLPRSR